MVIKALIFDIGNVLISFSYEKRLRQLGHLLDLSIKEVEDLLLHTGLNLEYEKGNLSPEELHLILSKKIGKDFDFDALIEAECNIFEDRPEMIPVLKKIKAAGHRLLILSNTNELHYAYLAKKYEFLSLFDEQILSFKVNLVKPDPAIYEVALKKAEAPAEACFYIDDIPEYIAAAKKMGIDGHVYSSFPLFLDALESRNIQVK